ncbi:MAG: diguanylate cyclase [Desulfobacterales bacterium]|nr:diguanylate cyclase [Desulfobacterales bacterium]
MKKDNSFNTFEIVTAPNWQYFIRLFLLLLFVIYMANSPDSLIIPRMLAYIGSFCYLLIHFYLRVQILKSGFKRRFVTPGNWLDIIMAHLTWLYDPYEPAPLFLYILIAVIGNGLQQGLKNLRDMSYRTAIMGPIVLILRIFFVKINLASFFFLILGGCLLVYTYLIVRQTEFYKNQLEDKTKELITKNDALKQEVENHTKTSEALRDSEKRYRNILESIEEAYFETDLSGNFTFFNDSLCKNLKYPKEEIMGMNYRKYTDEVNAKKVFHAFNRIHTTGETVKIFDWEFIRKDGTKSYVETSVSLIKDFNGNVIGFRGIARDVSERKKYEEELAYLAFHDTLTGLYNRKAFMERLRETLLQAKRFNIEKAILYIDLDKFKQVNDTYGHEIGDKLLIEVASRLRASLRDVDYICRLGGDEFTIILNNIYESRPEKVAERITEKISLPYHIDGHTIDFISSSIGISEYPKDGINIETLIRTADTAMYENKNRKKNRWD